MDVFAVAKSAAFPASLAEAARGYRWTLAETVLSPSLETIVGRRGVNDIRVVVVDGNGLHHVGDCTILLRKERYP